MIVILYLAEFVFSQVDGGGVVGELRSPTTPHAPIYWEDTWMFISWLGQGIDEE